MPQSPITTLGTAASMSISVPIGVRIAGGASSERKRPIAIESGAASSMAPNEVTIVSGRYLYTALVALAIALTAGWQHLAPAEEPHFANGARVLPLVLHALFIAVLLVPFLAHGVRL